MQNRSQILQALDEVRVLLLDARFTSIRGAQLILEKVVAAVTMNPGELVGGEIGNSVKLIRFLLDQASAFWAARQIGTSVNHYSSKGGCIPSSVASTIAVDA